MNQYELLKQIIKSSKSIVLFTGAGISVPSGIPDFRSDNGLYHQSGYFIPPEQIISHSYFLKNPKEFFEFYGSKMIYPTAKPNLAHIYFANLKNVSAVVTQNIDNLHQEAGSKVVYELHGSVKRNYCMKCKKFYSLEDIHPKKVNYCTCGGIIKPDVVLYEEPLQMDIILKAISAIQKADCLIVVGTSLVVYPAASYLQYFKKENLILINKSTTGYDASAKLVFNEDIIEVIKKIQE
ncbi:MAG: NAD-dependent protein deacylase [Anaeroplasmataceae bacterium]|nr:NAD-dependent protein deacylase [Anaeroplasmataceae bacterium]